MVDQKQIFIYILTAAGDRAEDAVTGFTLANVSLSMENKVTIVLLGYATLLAKQGYAETVHAAERLPLKTLMDNFLSDGGRVLCCGPCIKSRNMNKGDLVEGVLEVSAVDVNEAITEADKVISF